MSEKERKRERETETETQTETEKGVAKKHKHIRPCSYSSKHKGGEFNLVSSASHASVAASAICSVHTRPDSLVRAFSTARAQGAATATAPFIFGPQIGA